MDLAAMRNLLEFRRQIRLAEEHLGRLRQEEERLENPVAQALIDEGVQSMNLEGMTVYLSTAFHCTKRGDRSQADAVQAARELGLDDLIETSVQSQRIKAWANEQLKAARDSCPGAPVADVLPEKFLDTFNVHERTTIGSRKSSTHGAKT